MTTTRTIQQIGSHLVQDILSPELRIFRQNTSQISQEEVHGMHFDLSPIKVCKPEQKHARQNKNLHQQIGQDENQYSIKIYTRQTT